MSAYRAPKRGSSSVRRGVDIRRPHAYHASHVLRLSGEQELIKKSVEYHTLQSSRKRPRYMSPEPYPEPHADDTEWIDEPMVPANLSPLSDQTPCDQVFTQPPQSSPADSTMTDVPVEASVKQADTDPKKSRTVAKQIAEWLPHETTIMKRLLSCEHASDIDHPCACGEVSAVRKYRCHECGAAPSVCGACIERQHRHLHLHWIQHWNGRFFRNLDLAYVRHVIFLGHEDLPCPKISPTARPTQIIIVHTNGVHRCLVHFCSCDKDNGDQFEQLISSGYWPASLTRPEMAFTDAIMREWHLHWDISHGSAQDYFRVKVRLGNNAHPNDVEDRYRELLLAARLWRHYVMLKRSGRYHGVVIPHQDPRSLGVPCLACPWPELNLPRDWKTMTPDHLKYIYHIVFGCDGNFSLQKKSKNDDPNDRSLGMGEGYFVHPEKMRPLIENKYSKAVIIDTCHGFKWACAQRLNKFRFMDVSGIIATTCKHVLFRPQAVVNTLGGEALIYSDASQHGALLGMEDHEQCAMTYDVMCISIRHIVDRWKEYFPAFVSMLENLLCLLPRMHMYAHKDLCQAVYSLAYSEGFGLTHGEGVETPWAEFNIAGLSTREMSGGGREDALNSVFNHWNWSKIVSMAAYLSRKLTEAYQGQRRTTKYLAGLSALAGPKNVDMWLGLPFNPHAPTPLTFHAKEQAFAASPFLVNHSQLPSAKHAYEDLVEGHRDSESAPTHTRQQAAHIRKDLADFLMAGLRLEGELLDLRERDTKKRNIARNGTIVDAATAPRVTWHAWRKKLDKWRADQSKHMPSLGISPSVAPDASQPVPPHDAEDSDDSEPDEPDSSSAAVLDTSSPLSEVLGLPSDFPAEDRTLHGLDLLGDYEARLRAGQAFDQLEKVRKAVKHLSAFIEEKKENAHAVADNIRSNNISKFSVAYCQHLAKRYNHIYDRIVALRGDPKRLQRSDPASRLQRIDLTNDLKITNLKKAREEGDHGRSGSWIWAVFEDAMDCVDVEGSAAQPESDGPEVVSSSPPVYTTWFDRAQWFRAWQEKRRYDEAVNILCAEFRATITGLAAMGELWKGAAEQDGLHPGERAYAWQHHAMFLRMSEDARSEYDLARKKDVPADQLDHTRPLRPYLLRQVKDIKLWEDLLMRLERG